MSEFTTTIKCDPDLLKADHIIVCDFTKAVDTRGKIDIFVRTLDQIGKIATLGGANMGGKLTTVEIMSLEGLEGRSKLYDPFPRFFIVRIIDRINDEDVQIDFAVTKEDIYFFAYKLEDDRIWRNCEGTDYEIKVNVEAGFSVSYSGRDTELSLMLGLNVISQAIEGLHNQVFEKSSWFHTICRHFAEPCRFGNVRGEILGFMESELSGNPSVQFNRCLNNWSAFSKIWRRHVNQDLIDEEQNEEWTIPESIKACLPPLDPQPQEGELQASVEQRWKNLLWPWVNENLLILKGERLQDRQNRIGSYVPPLIKVPENAKVDRSIRNRHQLETKRAAFWTAKFAEAVDLRTMGLWMTLKELTEYMQMNPGKNTLVQLWVDNSDLQFPKDGNLLKPRDIISNSYEMESFLFQEPKHMK